MSQKYTIDDIARIAGVSRGTVSRVLNDHPSVSDGTRQMVLRIIEKLNYRPNLSARQMRTDNSNLVGFGLITDEVITTPYAVDMITGSQEALWSRNKVMLVVTAGYNSELTVASLEAMLERRVEGIIYASMFHRQVELPNTIQEVPTVLANCYIEDRSLPSVVPDEELGGYTATKTLLDAGHTRVAFINFSSGIIAAKERLKGYQRALTEYDIPFVEELVWHTGDTPNDNFNITLELMQITEQPTAIFCANDRIAMGCYSALVSLGLRIPQDVAVVGFDNQRDIADGLFPPLTTMQLPHYEMGRWAVEYLSGQTDHSSKEPVQHKLPCPLVSRKSV